MEMMRSNHKYNCNDYSMTIPHEAQCSSTVSSICSLVKQFMPTSTSSPTPRAKSHCKINRTETRPIQHKKQVRRRCHTTKPYQEQLLNMAEARKEIVTALKFHRASMKKQQQHQHQQQNVIIPALKHQVSSKQPKPQLLQEQQTLLVQDYVINRNASNCLGSTPCPLEGVNSEGLQVGHEMEFKKDQCKSGRGRCKGGAVEPRALDEEEMAEIRSIGEKHQVEWDDTLNLATYARWFKFLEQMEISEEGGRAYTL